MIEEIQNNITQVQQDIETLLENFTIEDEKALRALYDTLEFLEKQLDRYGSEDNS